MRVRTPPWGHQEEALQWIEERTGSLIAVGMGGGKTLIALMAMIRLLARSTVILCPARIPAVWAREFERHLDSGIHHLLFLGQNLDGKQKLAAARQAQKLAAARRAPLVVVVNYEAAWREPLRSWLLKLKPELLILDESHRIKSAGGRASMFCTLLGRRCRRRVGLTGTPMPHSPLDLYGQARALDPTQFGNSWVAFRSRYANVGGASGTEVLSLQREQELWEKFHSLAFVRTAEECTDLPELTEQIIPIQLCPKARLVYAKLAAHFWADVEAGTVTLVNALGRLTRLQQVTSGFVPLDPVPGDIARIAEIDDGKIAALADLLEDIPAGEPVVVFCRFVHDLAQVQALAIMRGLSYGEVSGRRADLTPHATIPDGIDLLGVQIRAGGIGVDLTRARVGVFYSIGFSLGDFQQAKARVRRHGGAHRHVTLVHLVAAQTIDETI